MGQVEEVSRTSTTAQKSTDINLPHIEVIVSGRAIRALVDTGSSANLISSRMAKQLPDLDIKEATTKLCGINLSPIKVEGEAEILVQIGGKESVLTVIIADVASDMVLGNPWVRTVGAKLDLRSRQITFPTDPGLSVRINAIGCQGEKGKPVVSSDNYEIQAFQAQWIIGEIDGDHYSKTNMPKDGLMIPAIQIGQETPIQRLKPEGEGYFFLINNATAETLEINKGENIGELFTNVLDTIPLEYEETGLSEDVMFANGTYNLKLTEEDQKERWKELLLTLKVDEWKISNSEKEMALEQLKQYQFVFALKEEPLGLMKDYEHSIRVKDVDPISQRPRPLTAEKTAVLDKIIEDLLQRGLIRPSRSPWSSPICMVPKPDGTYRLAVDFRKVNSVCVRDSHPLPNITYLLGTMNHSKYFSTMDMASGYHQLKLKETDISVTAFCTPTALYEWLVLPFGLAGAPPSFVRAMTATMKLPRHKCLLYLDDIMVLGTTFHEHLENILEVLSILRSANLKLKASKSVLFATSVSFLGHVVSERGITCTEDKIEAIKKLPHPTTPKEVRSYLGMMGYYRRFVHNYSLIARPLHRLSVVEKKHFIWDDEAKLAFETLRSKLICPPILALPQPSDNFVLTTDCSGFGIGAVLAIERDGDRRPVAYASHLLEKSRQNYAVTKRELFAVVYYCQYFKFYLMPKPFKIESDHRSLIFLTNFKEPSAMVARWIAILADYQYSLVYRKGTSGPIRTADVLSRIDPSVSREVAAVTTSTGEARELDNGNGDENSKRTESSSEELDPTETVPPQDELERYVESIRKEQTKDGDICKLVLLLKSNPAKGTQLPGVQSPAVKFYWSRREKLVLDRGILYYKNKKGEARIIVPKHKIPEFLKLVHDHPSAGHRSLNKMMPLLKEKGHWFKMKDDALHYTRQCMSCGYHNKPTKTRPQAALHMTRVSSRFERLSIDMLGPLPRSKLGNKFALVGVCCFTKFSFAIGLSSTDSEFVARTLISRWVMFFGCPLQIHSDRGSNFVSQLIQQLYGLLNIKHTQSLAYASQCNGAAERVIQSLKNMVRHYADTQPTLWDQVLPLCVMALNNQCHSATKITPQELVMGELARLPMDLIWGPPPIEEYISETTYVSWLRKTLHNIHEYARIQLETSIQVVKDRVDKGQCGKPYVKGDLVWLLKGEFSAGSRKFQRKYQGPFVVLEKPSDVSYHIEHVKNGSRQLVHFNRLKRCWVLRENLNFKKPKVVSGKKEAEASPVEPQIEIDSEEEDEVKDGVLFHQYNPDVEPLAPLPGNRRGIPVLLRRYPRRVTRPVARYL